MRSALVLMLVVLSLASGRAASAQSLGQVAAEEAARRKTVKTPARVITGDDIKPAEAVSSPKEIPPWPAEPSTAAGPRRLLVSPASLRGGGVPPIPVMAINGGEVYLEVDVTREGGVGAVKALRSTPPFTEALASTVKTWSFQPAQDAEAPAPGAKVDERTKRPVATKVLVVGVFRPPSLFQGATVGDPPKDVGAPSEAVAAPTAPATMPPYPARALYDGVVLVELNLKADGQVSGAKVLRSAAPFDALAMEAASAMSFRPPKVHGQAAATNVYVAVGFRQPMTP
jgi:TonB family protein